MKQLFFVFAVLALFGCEDNQEDTYSYAKIITQSKTYPVYLDMSEVGTVAVTTGAPQEAPFKIVANESCYFVGDRLRGIHVYEKKAGSAKYLCFIACRYLKDLELAGDRLFCNNLTDMVVLDVSNPLHTTVLHREKNLFNRFTSYKTDWNIPYVEGKGLIVGTETHELTGTVTDRNPDLDFTEFDQLYDHLTTKELPDTWFSDHPENDKPYIGMIRMDADQIYTYGKYNSWTICAYRAGTFSVREEDLWTTPKGKYPPPFYYADANPTRMFFADSLIYFLGAGYSNAGYCDCVTNNENYHEYFHLYFPTFRPLDITYLPGLREFVVLSGQSIWGAFKKANPMEQYMDRYVDFHIPTAATSIFTAGNHVVTLGNGLSVYLPSENELTLVKNYPDISGSCWSKAGNVLAVANTQGLFLYDISNPENITRIP